MFRDAKEELKRLEDALLAEEEAEEYEEEVEEEDDAFEPDAPEIADAGPYRNFANNYRAYNTDRTDVDLDEYSEAVRQPKGGVSCLGALALLLLGGIFVMLMLFVLKYYGFL